MASMFRERFDTALTDLNFARRSALLGGLGRQVKASCPEGDKEGLLAAIQGLAEPGAPAFVELARLIVARKAGCVGCAVQLLDHPCQSVRSAALSSGLLHPAEARQAFLSPDFSRQVKVWLVKVPELPCDQEVLEETLRLFSPAAVWQVLSRTQDKELLNEWFGRLDVADSRWSHGRLAGVVSVIKRFPAEMLELAKKVGAPVWVKDWDTLIRLAQVHPQPTLEWALGCKSLPETLRKRLTAWGWRFHEDVMLDRCLTHPQEALKLVTVHAGISSTTMYVTTNMKMATVERAFSSLPENLRVQKMATSFVELLPNLRDRPQRASEVSRMLEAFWAMVNAMPLEQRQRNLLGDDMVLLKAFMSKVPPESAVAQFLRISKELEVDTKGFKYVQSHICRRDDGRHDGLMQQVFERYLQKEHVAAAEVATMFKTLLEDAVSMDVVQSSFEALILRLGGHTELGLLYEVVCRLKQLNEDLQKPKGEQWPKPTLPLPVHWVDFVEVPKGQKALRPHVAFLHLVLRSGVGQQDLLGVVLEKEGPQLFWDAFEHLLLEAGSGGGSKRQPMKAKPKVDLSVLKELDMSGVARALTIDPVDKKGAAPGLQCEPAKSVYFDELDNKKKETFGKNSQSRLSGYIRLMNDAKSDRDPLKAFADFMQFLAERLNGEQEDVRADVLQQLLEGKCMPAELLEPNLEHLQVLHRISMKARSKPRQLDQTWGCVGTALVQRALRTWAPGEPPSAACLFALEAAPEGLLDLAREFVSATRDRREERQDPTASLCDAAAQWVFETLVPLGGASSLENFWDILQRLTPPADQSKGAERTIWEKYSFVRERWAALLETGVKHKTVSFVFVGVLQRFFQRQEYFAEEVKDADGTSYRPWWTPLEGRPYEVASSAILEQVQAGEIPAKEGSVLIKNRIRVVLAKEYLTSMLRDRKAAEAVDAKPVMLGTSAGCDHDDDGDWPASGQSTEVSSEVQRQCRECCKLVKERLLPAVGHVDMRRTVREMRLCDAQPVEKEIAALSRLLTDGRAQRHVLWRVADVGALAQGPRVTGLLAQALGSLDARSEGMACCIGRHYPYLNAALTRNAKEHGSPDVFTPLIELYLGCRDAERDPLVAELMKRPDAECLLFFGNRFAEHLSNLRQEWLHDLLSRLRNPEDGVEFYHFRQRVPHMARLALLGKGWRNMGSEGHSMQSFDTPHSQTYMWHPSTQELFLGKCLASTEVGVLALIPRMEYADGIARAAEVLDAHPRDQSKAQQEFDEWQVIQPTGAFDNAGTEVERRFLEIGPPTVRDEVGNREVEQLLISLGRADDAIRALAILGQYAGKVKRAKEAVVNAVPNLSPARARTLIKDVMFGPKAGVALQVAALRAIADTQVQSPLELYLTAWRDGKCHRDIAGSILAKVATSPAMDCTSADIPGLFDFFKNPERAEDHAYVADLLLNALKSSAKWSLPFLPLVVADLALTEGMTDLAIQALQKPTDYATEVLQALTKIIDSTLLALRGQGMGNSKRLRDDLARYAPFEGQTWCVLVVMADRLQLETCDPAVLRRFVELLVRHRCEKMSTDGKVLNQILRVWLRLLRPGQKASWAALLREAEELVAGSLQHVSDWGVLAAAVAERAPLLGDAEWPDALAEVRGLFERILDQLPKPDAEGPSGWAGPSDGQAAASRILQDVWPSLVARGCSEEESAKLFSRCPKACQDEATRKTVTVTVERAKEEKKPTEDVAKRALLWLASREGAEHGQLELLTELWPQVLALETTDKALPGAVAFLGGARPYYTLHYKLVHNLLKANPKAEMALAALRWLGSTCPRSAIVLWPIWLETSAQRQKGGSVPIELVRELLALCKAGELSVPAIPMKKCSNEVLALLAESELPAARLSAVQALAERAANKNVFAESEALLLSGLCADESALVRAAALGLQAQQKSGGSGGKKK